LVVVGKGVVVVGASVDGLPNLLPREPFLKDPLLAWNLLLNGVTCSSSSSFTGAGVVVVGFLKLILTICSFPVLIPFGLLMVLTSEVPVNGFLAASSSLSRIALMISLSLLPIFSTKTTGSSILTGSGVILILTFSGFLVGSTASISLS